jgi:hypothetical protein
MRFEDLYKIAMSTMVYKAKNEWTDLYLQYRNENVTLFVDKKLDSLMVSTYIKFLEELDIRIMGFNHKKQVGAYILSTICVPPLTSLNTPNPKKMGTVVKLV